MQKSKILSHHYTGRSLVVVYSDANGVINNKIASDSQPNWHSLVAAYKKQDFNAVIDLLDVSEAITKQFNGKFIVKDGAVFYNGQQVHGYIFDRIIYYMRERLPYQRLVRFAENLYANPNPDARDQFFKFLEHKNMPITEDGCFLAYKGVQEDYYSKTSGSIKVIKGKVKGGKIFNGVGEHIIVERSQVNANKDVGCAQGLHVGSYEYANEFKGNGRLMVVKGNPKNVVMVPTDCGFKKCRLCEYEVIAEEGRKLSEKRDINFDKAANARQKQKLNRDSLGRFC